MKFLTLKRKLLTLLLANFSMASMLFVFQACYGPPRNMPELRGVVTLNGKPAEGVKVFLNGDISAQTAPDGRFSIYAHTDSCTLRFESDSLKFQPKDTLVTTKGRRVTNVDIELSKAK